MNKMELKYTKLHNLTVEELVVLIKSDMGSVSRVAMEELNTRLGMQLVEARKGEHE